MVRAAAPGRQLNEKSPPFYWRARHTGNPAGTPQSWGSGDSRSISMGPGKGRQDHGAASGRRLAGTGDGGRQHHPGVEIRSSASAPADRKSVVWGKRGSVRLNIGG